MKGGDNQSPEMQRMRSQTKGHYDNPLKAQSQQDESYGFISRLAAVNIDNNHTSIKKRGGNAGHSARGGLLIDSFSLQRHDLGVMHIPDSPMTRQNNYDTDREGGRPAQE